MSLLKDELIKLLDTKDDKNYDPRMEELLRSDRLIDPTNECLSDLEDQEIFHIAKLRGAQAKLKIPMRELKKIYLLPHLAGYKCDYIDYIRSLDDVKDKEILDSYIGGMPMMNVMIAELIKLRRSKQFQAAKLYADSIKPQVANVPVPYPMPQEEKEGFFTKILNFFMGKKAEPQGQQGYKPR